MHYLSIPLLLILTSCTTYLNKKADIKVVHWNIKELSTSKIKSRPESVQIKSVKEILKKFDFNILSLNEIQYDLPNVPNRKYKSTAENAGKLLKKLPVKHQDFAISFNQANTGNKAKKSRGNYAEKITRQTRKYADQDNFGIYPGQYSSALLSNYPIKNEIIIKNLKWREFNKKVRISNFRRANGSKIPTGIQLFDKNFSDITIDINDQEVHIIMLHTVPAYHFGTRKSPNYERNRDQLRFLEWYLTGGTDIRVKLPKKYKHIKPLPKDAKFIALGDWNTSIYDNNKGSVVLRRIFKQVNAWIDKPSHTHEAQHLGIKRLRKTLDYIAYRGLKIVDSGIYHPEENISPCANLEDIPKSMQRQKLNNTSCINEELLQLKKASDHFPIWASFNLN